MYRGAVWWWRLLLMIVVLRSFASAQVPADDPAPARDGITEDEERILKEEERKLSEYVLDIIEHYKQKDPVGMPGTPIPEPLKIPPLKHSFSVATMNFKDVQLYGLSKFRIDYIESDLAAMEGTVTAVNESLCQFTLDNKFSVLAGDYYKHGVKGLPKISETITISNVVLLDNNYMYLDEISEISCRAFRYSDKCDRFCLEYQEKHNLNINDLLKIQEIVQKCKKLNIFNGVFISYSTILQNVTCDDVILKAYSFAPTKYKNREKRLCNFDDINFTFPYKYKSKYEEWCSEELSYTIQKNNNSDFLIGYLTFDSKINCLKISDGKHEVICLFITKNKSIEEYLDNFILVENYYYISEHYLELRENLEYFYFHIEDVILLDFKNKLSAPRLELASVACIVLHKCPVYYHNFKRRVEYWLMVKFTKNNFKCLISSNNFNSLYPLISVGTELRINIPENVDIKSYLRLFLCKSNYELNRVLNEMPAYHLTPDIRIEINAGVQQKIQLKEVFNDNCSHIIFTAIINNKGLSNPLSSRTALKDASKRKMFGTHGTQTHVLYLQNVENETEFLTLYLNNLENSLCPIGLLPGMKINVRLALRQNKYLKSCMMTYFEPLEYTPILKLNTTNNFSEDWDWGQSSIISKIEFPPPGTRIWGCIEFIIIDEIKFDTRCCVCKEIVKKDQDSCCEKADFQLDFEMMYKARDTEDLSYFTSKDLNILKPLFKLNNNELDILRDFILLLRNYSYNPSKTPSVDQTKVYDRDRMEPKSYWLDTFFSCNRGTIKNLDIKIIPTEKVNNQERWCCVEARDTIEG